MVLYSVFCVAKVIADPKAKGVYAAALIKKHNYCTKLVSRGLIDPHFEDKKVGYVGMIELRTQDNKSSRIFCIKDPDYAIKIMASCMGLDEL